MDKSSLRKQYKSLRAGLSPQEQNTKSITIAQRILQLPIWHLEVFHIFLPIKHFGEVDTQYVIHILQDKNKKIVLPKTDFSTRKLTHILLTPKTIFFQNQWGITEPQTGLEITPEAIEVVFVPLLTYDTKGNRVGYGKGFYDDFLSQCSPKTLKIGLSFFAPVQNIEDVSNDDIPLDYCVTPEQIYQF
ncbi:5-formyltetrahydrofolate cyclo-ligase [Capnocytophaga canimorsus]|uniref:5-formyltetrahydrofolate cyclo-ligase n=1 Tax=Capnocytophaga canimorsus TaxID=28188 RepID=UPI0037D65F92